MISTPIVTPQIQGQLYLSGERIEILVGSKDLPEDAGSIHKPEMLSLRLAAVLSAQAGLGSTLFLHLSPSPGSMWLPEGAEYM